tara:strand:+ start:37 stop:558 length:522 start_codon:yes stop_codon:yes gene_type:complete
MQIVQSNLEPPTDFGVDILAFFLRRCGAEVHVPLLWLPGVAALLLFLSLGVVLTTEASFPLFWSGVNTERADERVLRRGILGDGRKHSSKIGRVLLARRVGLDGGGEIPRHAWFPPFYMLNAFNHYTRHLIPSVPQLPRPLQTDRHAEHTQRAHKHTDRHRPRGRVSLCLARI